MARYRALGKNWGRFGVGMALAAASAWGGTACTMDAGEASNRGGEEIMGRVELALTTDASRFRLRAAVFEIKDATGNVLVTLNSEDQPEAQTLIADLPQGNFTVALASGWALERQGDDGGFSQVQAALLTPNPRSFEVAHEHATELVYSFTTDAGVVTLGRGSVSVGVDVVDSATLSSCRVLDRGSCEEGFTCLLAGETGATFCAQPGTLPVGAACDSEQCVAGAQCLRESGESTGVCKRFCDPNSTTPFCTCRGLSFDEGIGVCDAPPSCEPNCNAVPSFTFTDTPGDDVSANALYDFFAGLPAVSSSDYLLFEIVSGGAAVGAWCASNANFYVNNYLRLAASAGVVRSGNWEKYSRGPSGSWSGPDTSQYDNYFGVACNSTLFDWCSEWGLGGNFNRVMPGSTNWETFTGGGPIPGSTFKIAVGPTRAATCGF